MIVDIPQSPPIIDIPIGSETTPPDQPSGDLAEPKVLDLYNFADNLDDGTSRSESEEETAIMLSTDVLFETGESALSEDAEGVLEEAGIEIDDASGELIQIEGHADDTGSDAVNDPLSLDRAEAVRDHLEGIVTRSDVVFEAEGFGSTDPIADNESEDGREKNRRVTVTFAK
ncbi:OmpA family protein [Spiractinospora alimapuensis]|nr:OmpA family protein [Spiractinospora alimapuensis]